MLNSRTTRAGSWSIGRMQRVRGEGAWSPAAVAGSSVGRISDWGEWVVELLRRRSLPTMRILMGVLFLWFGGLKVAGLSPVSGLVAGTLPWVDPELVVPVLGAVEVLLGCALVMGIALRLALSVLAAHLAGTFLTFVMLPAWMFRDHNPLLLTADGEFVAKNLVLVSAAIVLITHATGFRRDQPELSGSGA
jgi:putative oxidoreductase